MNENFHPWSCKSSSSHLFYEHFINKSYNTYKKSLRTCWCTKTKPNEYHDYIKDIQYFRASFCETVCGDILAKHSIISHHSKNTLKWLIDIDHNRFLYKIKDFLNRPLRLSMYNKYELVHNKIYLTYQTSMNSSCRRYYHANQMYSSEYFLYDYFQYLKKSYPTSRHNLVWTNDPLLADYYIIPHDYVCIAVDFYRPTLTDSEYRFFHLHLNEEYFLPLLNNVRTQFLYWNMTLGSNRIITFTIGKNMGIIQSNLSLDILKNVIQLGLTGFRQDLLPHNSHLLYLHRNVKTIYRHNYDIIIPACNRLQWVNDKPLINNSSIDMWYKMKKNLLFFAETVNNSISFESVRRHLSLLIKDDIGKGKKYENEINNRYKKNN